MDLFGLARGYGLSCVFMLMSLYHFIEYLQKNKRTDVILFHIAALLASLSNFTLVTFYVTLLLVYNLQSFLDSRFIEGKKFSFFQSNKVHIIPFILSTIVLYEPLRRLLTYSDLNFGGKNGFYEDTVIHLILNTFHHAALSPTITLAIQILFTLIVLIPLIIIIRNAILRKHKFFIQNKGLIALTFILIFISVIIISQHLILKSDYPKDRFSIFLFPLFIIHLGLFINLLIASGYKKICLIILSCISITSAISYWNNTNLYSSAEWDYDSNTKNMLETLTSYKANNHDQSKKVTLGINWLFEPTINFYRKTHNLSWLMPVDRKGIEATDDYLYIFENEINKIEVSNYKVIKKYENSRTLLMKRVN